MNRRGFFGALAAIAAAATLDPERLLWVPGKKLISIPAPAPPLVLAGGYWLTLAADGRFLRGDGFSGQAFFVNGEVRIVSDDGHFFTPEPRALGQAITRMKALQLTVHS